MATRRTRRVSSVFLNSWRVLACIGALTCAMAHASAQAEWQRIRVHDGIMSWESERPGQPLSAYRARTVLRASAWEAVAVLEDVERACEWTSHCAEMKPVPGGSDGARLVYARMDAPWPVRDRDVVVEVRAAYDVPGELTLQIAASSRPRLPPVADVVRMLRFRAHYRFRLLADERCEVEYQIDVDPGGTLPDWLKRLVARDLADDTLDDLRDRVRWAHDRGLYRGRIEALAVLAAANGFRARADASEGGSELVLQ